MAQTVESSQDRTQVIPLTKLKIAMHEDECVNEGTLDLHEETRRRVRGHIGIVLDYHVTFSLPEQRAPCRARKGRLHQEQDRPALIGARWAYSGVRETQWHAVARGPEHCISRGTPF